MTNNDDRNHVGSCWSSSPITYNSKWSTRTPRVLTKKEVRYNNVCKTKVAPNYIIMCGTNPELMVILSYHLQLQGEHKDPLNLDIQRCKIQECL